jgi:hypothetical protein
MPEMSDEFWRHRKSFAAKRARDEQKRRALAQFGKGIPPPTPEDPEPTREPRPLEGEPVDAIAEVA